MDPVRQAWFRLKLARAFVKEAERLLTAPPQDWEQLSPEQRATYARSSTEFFQQANVGFLWTRARRRPEKPH